MIKHLITAASFALGSTAGVLVGYLGSHPRAFTQAVAALPPVEVSRALAAIPVAIEPADDAIVLTEVRITALDKRAQRQSVPPGRLDPCSEWSDVGAVFIDPAGASGVRRVRNLCNQPVDRR
jgi:hypothetical protein